jgi:hypothetical protein
VTRTRSDFDQVELLHGFSNWHSFPHHIPPGSRGPYSSWPRADLEITRQTVKWTWIKVTHEGSRFRKKTLSETAQETVPVSAIRRVIFGVRPVVDRNDVYFYLSMRGQDDRGVGEISISQAFFMYLQEAAAAFDYLGVTVDDNLYGSEWGAVI